MDLYLPLIGNILKHITLSPEEEGLIRTSFHVRKLQKRQFLLQDGDVCKYESYVVSGCMLSYVIDGLANKHTQHFAIEDWWITDLESFLKGTPASRNIVALEDTVVLQINKTDLEYLYEHISGFERFFRILHQNGAMAQDRRILNNISLSGAERYELFVKNYPLFLQRIPQKYIASYLGITPEFLSTIRKDRTHKA